MDDGVGKDVAGGRVVQRDARLIDRLAGVVVAGVHPQEPHLGLAGAQGDRWMELYQESQEYTVQTEGCALRQLTLDTLETVRRAWTNQDDQVWWAVAR